MFHVMRLLALTALLASLTVPALAAPPACFGQSATIVGTARADVLVGTPHEDVIVSRGGADTIRARGGDDLICAGGGRDVVRGGGGDDAIDGGAGKDTLRGGSGTDTCVRGENVQGCEPPVVTPPPTEADLSVAVQGPPSMRDGDVLDWVFPYVNHGPAAADAVLTVTIHPRLSVHTLPPGCIESPIDTVTCQLGSLAPGATGQRIIRLAAPPTCNSPFTDTLTVSATIDSTAPDPVAANDSDSQNTAYDDQGC